MSYGAKLLSHCNILFPILFLILKDIVISDTIYINGFHLKFILFSVSDQPEINHFCFGCRNHDPAVQI
ncbi:hypothetical protein GYH30_052464 [Glycine max]|nr:hypothetical protein GYH30_052464 [Glycine max]